MPDNSFEVEMLGRAGVYFGCQDLDEAASALVAIGASYLAGNNVRKITGAVKTSQGDFQFVLTLTPSTPNAPSEN